MSARKSRRAERWEAWLAEKRKLRVEVSDPRTQAVIDKIYDAFQDVDSSEAGSWPGGGFPDPYEDADYVVFSSDRCWEELVTQGWTPYIVDPHAWRPESLRYFLPAAMVKSLTEGAGDFDAIFKDESCLRVNGGQTELVLNDVQRETIHAYIDHLIDEAIQRDDVDSLDHWSEISRHWQSFTCPEKDSE